MSILDDPAKRKLRIGTRNIDSYRFSCTYNTLILFYINFMYDKITINFVILEDICIKYQIQNHYYQ